VLVKSSNDIAQALARDNAGSVAAFVEKMNEKAKALGLQNTHFVNPHGLPGLTDDQPYSTARDLAVIAKWADKMPEIRAIVKLQSYKFKKPDGKFIDLANTNRVLRTASYCDGMKTGYTDAAGYCLVATGERNGRRRIVVILNDTESGVWKDAQALLDWALKA
jgi:D-alanyl-D-alanine carboxypeptidase (penicillin-binding protein 5/6)